MKNMTAKITAFTILALAMVARQTTAQSITVSDSSSSTFNTPTFSSGVGFYSNSDTLWIARFDPSLGILTSISATATASLSPRITIQRTGTGTGSLLSNLSFAYFHNFQYPGGTGFVNGSIPVGVVSVPVTGSVTTNLTSWSQTNSWQITSQLGAYQGTGIMGFGVPFTYHLSASGPVQHSWRLQPSTLSLTLTYHYTPWWSNAGPGTSGTAGTPSLTASGGFGQLQQSTLSVSNAALNSVGIFVVGLSRVDTPLFGGTLVPSPDIYFAFPTDQTGSYQFAFTASLVGSAAYFQSVILDPAGTSGFSMSNALKGQS